jgi:hypothetical protein
MGRNDFPVTVIADDRESKSEVIQFLSEMKNVSDLDSADSFQRGKRGSLSRRSGMRSGLRVLYFFSNFL